MKFYMKSFVSIMICIIVVAVYPVLTDKAKSKGKAAAGENDFLEQLGETARSYIKDPKQLVAGIRDAVGAISETFFKEANHDAEKPADKYSRPVETEQAPLKADNLFDLLQEIQQIYSDFNEGKKLDVNKVTKLIIRFFDFIVVNPDMDTFLIEMLSKFEYGPLTKPMIKSTLEAIIGGYRNIRKMNGVGEIVEAASKYISLDTLADKNYLTTLVSTYGTLVLGSDTFEKYRALADSIIQFISVVADHLREANIRDASKNKSQFNFLNAFDEYITLIPSKELIVAFDKYNYILKSMKELHKDISDSKEERLNVLKDKIGNLLPSFEKAESELRKKSAQFDTKFSQEIESVFAKLKGLASDLKVVSKIVGETNLNKVENLKLKKDLEELSQTIQAELKRWTLLKEIKRKAKNIKNIEEWKSLIIEMASFTNGVTNFEKITNAAKIVYEELNKLMSNSGFNLKRKTEL